MNITTKLNKKPNLRLVSTVPIRAKTYVETTLGELINKNIEEQGELHEHGYEIHMQMCSSACDCVDCCESRDVLRDIERVACILNTCEDAMRYLLLRASKQAQHVRT